jgi:ribonuclease-3
VAIGKDFKELLLAIEYTFKDISLLECALTHSSYSNEYRSKGLSLPSNERLEFLGDAVLQILVSEYLYDNFQDHNEGKLTVMRQRLVCEKTLASIARSLQLGDYLHLGKGEEADCRNRSKVLANALEALIGAIFIDCRQRGSDEYKQVVIRLLDSRIIKADELCSNDYKTRLQKLVEQSGQATLEYQVTSEDGPDHDKYYSVVVKGSNNEVGKGRAHKKRDAEMQAAKMALELFGIKEN